MSFGVLCNSAIAMMSQSHAMGQISTNIANVNTSGYKSSETLFKTQLSGETSGFDIYTASTTDRRAVDIAGNTVISGNVHDMTISGEGLFVVSDSFNEASSGNTYYTRAGDFLTAAVEDADGTNAYLVNQSGYYIMGWNADRATGEFSNTLEPIRVTPLETIDGVATSDMTIRANISSNTKEIQNINVPIFDNKFQSHGLDFNFQPIEGEIANQWLMTPNIDNGTVTTNPFIVRFDDLGNIIEPANGEFSLNVAWDEGGSSSINFDMSDLTQLGERGTLLYDVEQNGMESGQLSRVHWDDDGVLHGTYTNTRTIEIAKIAVATFTAPNSLEAISGNMFAYNQAAGEIEINDLSKGDLTSTSIESETYESSNVDLSDQFTKMITTQKAYSSAATVFQTGDEMLQTATGLKA